MLEVPKTYEASLEFITCLPFDDFYYLGDKTLCPLEGVLTATTARDSAFDKGKPTFSISFIFFLCGFSDKLELLTLG
jgi:hypothetical protein